MKAQDNQYSTRLLNRILDVKTILFGFTILHVMAMVMYIVHYEQEFSRVSDHWNPLRLMQEPVLLLLGAAALLVSKRWSYLVAIVTSGRVIYVLGYLGLVATSSAHDRSILSWYVVRAWGVIMLKAQPQYIVELVLATVIGTYAVILLLRSSRKL